MNGLVLYWRTDAGKGFVQKFAILTHGYFEHYRGICKGLCRQWLSRFDPLDDKASSAFWKAHGADPSAMMKDAVRRQEADTFAGDRYEQSLDKCLKVFLQPGRKRIGLIAAKGHSIAAVVKSASSGWLFDPTFGEYTIGKGQKYATFEALFADLWEYYDEKIQFTEIRVWNWEVTDIAQGEDPREDLEDWYTVDDFPDWESIEVPHANDNNNNNNNPNNNGKMEDDGFTLTL